MMSQSPTRPAGRRAATLLTAAVAAGAFGPAACAGPVDCTPAPGAGPNAPARNAALPPVDAPAVAERDTSAVPVVLSMRRLDVVGMTYPRPGRQDESGIPSLSVRGAAVNAAGQVVGDVGGYTDATGYEAATQGFVTGPGGVGLRGIGYLRPHANHPSSFAVGVNDRGQVVGLDTGDRVDEVFLTAPSGRDLRGIGALSGTSLRPTGSLGSLWYIVAGGPESTPGGLNAAGRVTGVSNDARACKQAFLTGPDGRGMRGLGFLAPSIEQPSSEGVAVNAAGQVAGTSSTGADEERQAFLTMPNGGAMRGLGSLASATGGRSEAAAVNASGQVVGTSENAAGRPEAFLTGPDGAGMRALGFGGLTSDSLPGLESRAAGVSDAGAVVGQVTGTRRGTGRGHGFLYSAATGFRFLDDILDANGMRGWSVDAAHAVRDDGWVVVSGRATREHASVGRTYLLRLSTPWVAGRGGAARARP